MMPQCDICGAHRPCVVHVGQVVGIETWACHVCRGFTAGECEDCEEVTPKQEVREWR